jgi:hypothetical protein
MAKNNRNWTTMYENNNQTLMVDNDSGSDYIIGGDDVERLRVIVEHLKTDWPELADTINEVITNLVEV